MNTFTLKCYGYFTPLHGCDSSFNNMSEAPELAAQAISIKHINVYLLFCIDAVELVGHIETHFDYINV